MNKKFTYFISYEYYKYVYGEYSKPHKDNCVITGSRPFSSLKIIENVEKYLGKKYNTSVKIINIVKL